MKQEFKIMKGMTSGTFRAINSSIFTINLDNSLANSGNINIDRPSYTCAALNEAEAVGKMVLSNFSHKHLPIINIEKL